MIKTVHVSSLDIPVANKMTVERLHALRFFKALSFYSALGTLTLLLASCQTSDPQRQKLQELLAEPVQAMPSVLQDIPFAGPAFDVLVDDVDGDGRLDLIFTSHRGNYSQVFYQRSRRRFVAGPRIEAVGFHPGEFVRLPDEQRKLYLMNAEGINQLLVMEPAEAGGLSVVSSGPGPQPRYATAFNWPDWGLGLAVVPVGVSKVVLVKNFDPETGQVEDAVTLPMEHTYIQGGRIIAADLDGDGIDELVLATSLTHDVLVIRYPQPGAKPRIELLWHNVEGGRARHVQAADINQDGAIDLILADETRKDKTGRTEVNILLNNGQGQFTPVRLTYPLSLEKVYSVPEIQGFEKYMPGIRAVDFGVDKDGSRYLFAAGYETFTLFRLPENWPEGAAESRTLKLARTAPSEEAVIRDVDGDGWLDIVVARARTKNAGLVIYGPLWEHFSELAEQDVVVR